MRSNPRDWAVAAVSSLRRQGGPSALAKDVWFRLERKYATRYSDVQVRQLRSLERSYRKPTGGPDILMFGDSAMYWTAPTDTDHRHLAAMIHDELGIDATFEALVGPIYNPRIMMAFLSAFRHLPGRPKVVLIPLSIMASQRVWMTHPDYGYEHTAVALEQVIEAGGKRPRRLPPDPIEDRADKWERLPAPSLFGARRTLGELRLILNAVPATKWQKIVRLRHLMDFYNAEALTPESPGVLQAAELGAMVRELGMRSVAYIPPVNHGVVKATLGEEAREHVRRNADLIAQAYLEAAGEGSQLADGLFQSPPERFIDPIHVDPQGRLDVARLIAQVARPMLLESEERQPVLR